MVLVKAMRLPRANVRSRSHAPAKFLNPPLSRTASLGIFACLLFTVVLAPHDARAQLSGASQYDVEAVYLYHFAKFVRWPAGSPGASLNICVDAQKIFVDALTKVVAGERIDSRPLHVQTIQRPGDETSCNMLFLDATAKGHLDELLAATSGKPILTVSDIPDFLARGGMIQLFLIHDRMRFSVDLTPIARSKIALSSELLKVAATVKGRSAGGGAP